MVPNADLLLSLKMWRDEKAGILNIDPSMIANKSQLIWLAAPGTMPWTNRYDEAHLMQWQRKIWNQILQEKLPTAPRNTRS